MPLTPLQLSLRARKLRPALIAAKQRLSLPSGEWYRYDVYGNLKRLRRLLGFFFDLGALAPDGVYDLGAADGEMSFLFESFGVPVTAIDHAATNSNRMQGIRLLAQHRESRIAIHDVDLDALQPLPAPDRSLALFLGALYHLKNPLGVLELVRERCSHCLLSTRIAQETPDHSTSIDGYPLAYLLHASECNDDATNYWIFSFEGLRRVVERAGWEVVKHLRDGRREHSDPVQRDERAFLLLRRR